MIKKAILLDFNNKQSYLLDFYNYLVQYHKIPLCDIICYSDLIKHNNLKTEILNKLKHDINKISSTGGELWFYYIGQSKTDTNNNEEYISLTEDNFIYKYELYEIIKTVPKNCKFYGIIDSCYSKTLFNLPYSNNSQLNNYFSKKNKTKQKFSKKQILVLSSWANNDMQEPGKLTTLFIETIAQYQDINDILVLDFVNKLSDKLLAISFQEQNVVLSSSYKIINNSKKLFSGIVVISDNIEADAINNNSLINNDDSVNGSVNKDDIADDTSSDIKNNNLNNIIINSVAENGSDDKINNLIDITSSNSDDNLDDKIDKKLDIVLEEITKPKKEPTQVNKFIKKLKLMINKIF